jgi:predicted SAM-dependent methyltransferase
LLWRFWAVGSTEFGPCSRLSLMSAFANVKKTYTRVPAIQTPARLERLARAAVGSVLFPLYWLRARRHGLPGLEFGIDSFRLGLRSLLGNNGDISYAEIYRMLFAPLESTRYFEFGLAWDFLSNLSIGRYLDVSSPRLFPIALMTKRREATAELINPNQEDLKTTVALARVGGLASRCSLSGCLIEEASFPPSTFDLITSISVVEHIPADKSAVQRMWELLRPMGRLVLSVPCAAVAEEQYIDVDQFGLQRPDDGGFFFLQYVYDDALLQERFYSVAGPPTRHGIYGEREPGSLRRGLIKKWSGGNYPRWREPYTMAQDFQRYETLSDLPGEGVIVMEFEKK